MGTYPHYGVYSERREIPQHRLPGAAFLGQPLQGDRQGGIHAAQMDHGYDLPGAQRKLDAIRSTLEQVFLTKTRDEWFDLLSPQDIPIGKVYDIGEVLGETP